MTSNLLARSVRADSLIREINVAIDTFEQGMFTDPWSHYDMEYAIDSMLDLVDQLEALGTDPGAVVRFREDICSL